MMDEFYSGYKTGFQNKKDSCHWLIQTKCGIPLISVDANIPGLAGYKTN